MSVIVWKNEFSSDNRFSDFGQNEALARAAVHAAISDWNKASLAAGHADVLSIPISVADLDAPKLGVTTTVNGKPISVELDANGQGYGWYLSPGGLVNDPTFATIHTPYEATSLNGSQDLFTTVLHELGHVEGFVDLDNPATALDNNGNPVVGQTDSSHTANPDDLMVPAEGSGTRHLISEYDIRHAFGNVEVAFTPHTFIANSSVTGVLTLHGTSGDDEFILNRNFSLTVNGHLHDGFSSDSVAKVIILPGAGNDKLVINGFAMAPIEFNGGTDRDTVIVNNAVCDDDTFIVKRADLGDILNVKLITGIDTMNLKWDLGGYRDGEGTLQLNGVKGANTFDVEAQTALGQVLVKIDGGADLAASRLTVWGGGNGANDGRNYFVSTPGNYDVLHVDVATPENTTHIEFRVDTSKRPGGVVELHGGSAPNLFEVHAENPTRALIEVFATGAYQDTLRVTAYANEDDNLWVSNPAPAPANFVKVNVYTPLDQTEIRYHYLAGDALGLMGGGGNNLFVIGTLLSIPVSIDGGGGTSNRAVISYIANSTQIQATNIQNRDVSDLLAPLNPGYVSPLAPEPGNPRSFFDEDYYLASNPDVAAAVKSGLFASGWQHFQLRGQYESRRPSTLYSEDYYLSHNPDVKSAVQKKIVPTGFYHFVYFGYMSARAGSATPMAGGGTYQSPLIPRPGNLQSFFDERYYLALYPDVRKAVSAHSFASGWAHFVAFGQFEGRNPSTIFDNAYYLRINKDVAAALAAKTIASGFQHFVYSGFWKGRSGSDSLLGYSSPISPVSGVLKSFFDETYYLMNNSDVRAAVWQGKLASGWSHFLAFGQFEGRRPSTIFDEAAYVKRYPQVAAAVKAHTIPTGLEDFVKSGFAAGRIGT